MTSCPALCNHHRSKGQGVFHFYFFISTFIPNRSLEKTPSICKHTPMFLCVVDNRNFLIARKYSVFKQKKQWIFLMTNLGLSFSQITPVFTGNPEVLHSYHPLWITLWKTAPTYYHVFHIVNIRSTSKIFINHSASLIK